MESKRRVRLRGSPAELVDGPVTERVHGGLWLGGCGPRPRGGQRGHPVGATMHAGVA